MRATDSDPAAYGSTVKRRFSVRGPLIPLSEVTRYLEVEVDTKTVRDWATRGLRGVRLDVVRCLGRTFVTLPALAVFLNAVDGEPR